MTSGTSNPQKSTARGTEWGKKSETFSFKTKNGNRVFRRPYNYKGERKFSRVFTFRVKYQDRQYDFKLGTDPRKAGKLADEICAFLSIGKNTIEDALNVYSARSKKQPTKLPTVGEYCSKYESITQHLSRATVRGNLCALRRIAAFALGLPAFGKRMPKKDRKEWRLKVDSLPLCKLTLGHLEDFRSSLIRSAGSDHVQRGKATTTANSYLRSIKSMFSEKWSSQLGEDYSLDENPFRKVRRLPEPPHRYQSKIDAVKLITKAREDLKDDLPAYTVLILCLVCGMRRSEIDRLSWDQIDFGNRHVWIRTTPYFKPKARNSENRIDAPDEVFILLERLRTLRDDSPFVIPGSNQDVQIRCNAVFRRLLKWLRENGVNERNAMHTLRKEAGSLIYTSTGSIDIAADFLRNDPRVAKEHYVVRKGRIELSLPGIINEVD